MTPEKWGWVSVGFLLAWGMRKVAIPIITFGAGGVVGAIIVLAYKGVVR